MSDGDSYTEVTKTSWGSRIGGSFWGIGFGLLLIAAATALLWWNEGRTVRTGDAIAEAQEAAVPMPSIARVDSAYEGQLVHAAGRAVTGDVLSDDMFGVAANAIKLRREVEYYQWVEDSHIQTIKKPGGGEETVTTYYYTKKWVNDPVDSQSFSLTAAHINNTLIRAEAETWLASHIAFGAYRLPEFLAKDMEGEKILPVSFSDEQRAKLQKALFGSGTDTAQAGESAAMVHTADSAIYIGRHPGSPAIGDVRIKFYETPAAEISILAQISGDTFVPFCASNGAKFFRLAMGVQDMDTMFEDAKSENGVTAWLLRVAGIIMCIIGFKLILEPLRVLADFIPLLGSIVGAGAGLVSGLLGIAWSLIIIAAAWIRFRPVLAFCLLGAAAVLVVLLFLRGRRNKSTPAAA